MNYWIELTGPSWFNIYRKAGGQYELLTFEVDVGGVFGKWSPVYFDVAEDPQLESVSILELFEKVGVREGIKKLRVFSLTL